MTSSMRSCSGGNARSPSRGAGGGHRSSEGLGITPVLLFGILRLLRSPLRSPVGQRKQGAQKGLPLGSELVAQPFVDNQPCFAQLGQARVQQRWIRRGGGLQHAKGLWRAIAQLPEYAQCTPASQEVESGHDRPPGSAAAHRAADGRRCCFTFHSDRV